MNLKVKTFLGFLLSLILFCAPVSAQEPVKKNSKGKEITLQQKELKLKCYVVLYTLDLVSVVISFMMLRHHFVNTARHGENLFSAGLAAFLFFQQVRGLLNDGKEVTRLMGELAVDQTKLSGAKVG